MRRRGPLEDANPSHGDTCILWIGLQSEAATPTVSVRIALLMLPDFDKDTTAKISRPAMRLLL